MKIFIKTLDTAVWKAVQKECKPPTKTSTTSFGEVELKSIDDWTNEDCHLDNVNTKVLNTIFSTVGLEEFKLISTCRALKMHGINCKSV
jgi:hypothetical protein